MTDILIRGARVYDRAGDIHRPPVRDVLVRGDRIAAIALRDTIVPDPACEVLEAAGHLLIPGLVNAHYHSNDVLCRGRFEDMPFDVWALHAFPAYWGPRSRAEVRARTLLGAVECLRNGITTIQDMNTVFPQDEETLDIMLDAYAQAGIRVSFSIAVRDVAGLDIAPFLPADMPAQVRALVAGAPADPEVELAFVEAQIRRLRPLPPRLHWALGPSGPQRCSRKLLEGVADLSDRYGLPVLTHTYETRAQLARGRADYPGGSLVEFLAETGLLTARTTLAHGVYLRGDEIERLAAAGTGLVHNPMSNLKLKNGVAPLLGLRKAGVNVALGCDNCSCSDCQNMFQSMKMYALLAQASQGEPSGVLACDAIDAGTIGGARALGLAGEIGEVREGCRADLALIDLSEPSYLPFNSAARQLVYAESGRGVRTVIVDGRIVVRDGRATMVDEAALAAEIAELSEASDRDYAALVERQAPAVPYLLRANAALAKADLGINRFVGDRDA